MTAFEDFVPPPVGSLWEDDKGLQRLVVDVTGDGRFVTWRRPGADLTSRMWWASWRTWEKKAVRIDAPDTELSVLWLEAVGFEIAGVMFLDGHSVINIECPPREVLTTVGRLTTALAYANIPVAPIGTEGAVWAEVCWDIAGTDGVITITGLSDAMLPSQQES